MKRLLRQPLLWITVGALLLRLGLLLSHPVVLTEGTTYVTIAHNLLAGHGYVGILGGREPFAPPLYPWLIAAGTVVTGQGVTSARLVSWLAGIALVPATFWLGRQLFDRRSGLWAALLVAGTPLLVEYSSLEWSETLYAVLLVTGLALAWQARRSARGQLAVLAGLSLGAAYLTRVEGALAAAVAALWLVLARYPSGRARWQLPAALLGAFALLALPYVVWLSSALNRPAWESKSGLNFVIAQRMAAGASYVDAAYGLDASGRPTGVFLARGARLVEGAPPADEPAVTAGQRLHLFGESAAEAWGELRLYLLSPWMLLALAGGVFVTLLPASRRAGWHWATGYLGSFLLPALVVIILVPQVYTRYLAPLLPLGLVWVGVALARLHGWVTVWTAARGWGGPRGARWAGALVGLALALLLLSSLPRSSSVTVRRAVDVDQQRAGAWLAQHVGPSPLRIMAVHSQIPFYANGIHVPLPNGTPAQVLAYAETNAVDVIVTSPRKLAGRPRLAAWRNGAELPAPWHIVYRDDQAVGGPLLLWEK